MELKEYLEECNIELTCTYCWKRVKWSFSYYWWCITSKEALKRHEEECEKNPNSPLWILLKDIQRCQNEAKIFNCLNCQHYQKKCSWTKN